MAFDDIVETFTDVARTTGITDVQPVDNLLTPLEALLRAKEGRLFQPDLPDDQGESGWMYGISAEPVSSIGKRSTRFRREFLDGLVEFADLQDIIPIADGKYVLDESVNLYEVNRGLQLNLQPPSLTKENLEQYKKSQRSYRMGFALGIAREYGLVIQAENTPYNSESFSIFNYGKDGIDEIKLEDIGLVKRYQSFYEAGLKIWLLNQDITEVTVEEINQPELLRAFKEGMAGKNREMIIYVMRDIEDALKRMETEGIEALADTKFDRFDSEAAYQEGRKIYEQSLGEMN